MGLVTRRQLIAAATGITFAGVAVADPAEGLLINPRSSWGSDLPPKGELDAEDVKFLIVHHSASHNGHTAADAPAILRSWYDYHTGPDKGWNDIAYNFVIDSEGGIWEARAGSLDGPVAGDATGGNQGFTQLVAIIGDYNQAHPTRASLTSLVRLLAWLADRYGVSTSAGSEVTFTSRGSNKWPEGASVTTPTITGHRTMSKTTCPGDNLNPYVAGGLMADVEAARSGDSISPSTTTTSAPTTTTTTTKATTTTTEAATSTSEATTTTAATTTTTAAPTAAAAGSTTVPGTSAPSTSAPPQSSLVATSTTVPAAAEPLISEGSSPLLIGAGALVALGSGLLVWRHNRLNR